MTGSWLGESSYKGQFQNPRNYVSSDKKDELGISQITVKSEVTAESKKNPSSHFSTLTPKQKRPMEAIFVAAKEQFARQLLKQSKSRTAWRRVPSRTTLTSRDSTVGTALLRKMATFSDAVSLASARIEQILTASIINMHLLQ
jgi:hypothetical protein